MRTTTYKTYQTTNYIMTFRKYTTKDKFKEN